MDEDGDPTDHMITIGREVRLPLIPFSKFRLWVWTVPGLFAPITIVHIQITCLCDCFRILHATVCNPIGYPVALLLVFVGSSLDRIRFL